MHTVAGSDVKIHADFFPHKILKLSQVDSAAAECVLLTVRFRPGSMCYVFNLERAAAEYASRVQYVERPFDSIECRFYAVLSRIL